MADDYASHTTHIEVDDAFDVMVWGLVLNVTPAAILEASRIVGPDALQVQQYLARGGKGGQ
ncbi:MAG: DUF3606 domain-containing protein [Luteibacter sp.]